MALLDLSLVTTALVELLKAHIAESPVWKAMSPNAAPKISPVPPDRLEPGEIGVYLYHVTEEAHTKNLGNPTGDQPPVRCAPMGLSLYYQVSALGIGTQPAVAALAEQSLLGCAIKALHDYPCIDDRTAVPQPPPKPPLKILEKVGLDGEHNRLRIGMLPIAHTDASTFWSAASRVPRLAAYYQVSVVLLTPERPASLTTPVLRYDIQTFVGGAPRLDGSENTVEIAGVLPAVKVTARPAEVPFLGQVAFTGHDLAGDTTRLLVQHERWPEPLAVDATWGVQASESRVLATVMETVSGQTLLPGRYAARVEVVRRRVMPDGTTREYATRSNATPFTISARIATVTEALGVHTIQGHLFAQPDATLPAFPADAVQLFVGGAALTRTDNPPNAAEFRVVDAHTIVMRLAAPPTPGQPQPMRLFVFGAESPPRWLP